MEVIQHDVRRLDRLISDISDASRLDAELARIQSETIDIAELLRNMADAANQRTGTGGSQRQADGGRRARHQALSGCRATTSVSAR